MERVGEFDVGESEVGESDVVQWKLNLMVQEW